MTPVRLEPAALRSRVKHSTIEPLRSRERIVGEIRFIQASIFFIEVCFSPCIISAAFSSMFILVCLVRAFVLTR